MSPDHRRGSSSASPRPMHRPRRKFGGTGLGLSITRAFAGMLVRGDHGVKRGGPGNDLHGGDPSRITGTNDDRQPAGEETFPTDIVPRPGTAWSSSWTTIPRRATSGPIPGAGRLPGRGGRGWSGGSGHGPEPEAAVVLLDVNDAPDGRLGRLRAIRGETALHDTPVIMVTVLAEQSPPTRWRHRLPAEAVDWDELHAVMERFRPQPHSGARPD